MIEDEIYETHEEFKVKREMGNDALISRNPRKMKLYSTYLQDNINLIISKAKKIREKLKKTILNKIKQEIEIQSLFSDDYYF